jgi:outer membrane protein OmpA-like peptidoglycan-associated protein
MKWSLTGLLTVFVIEMHAPPKAEACGVKLTVKSKNPKKAVTRSSNPSNVLLLGSPPPRLERELTAAGHRVEVAREPNSAKRKTYAVVIADSGLQADARKNFADAIVMVRSSDVTSDIRSFEKQVTRTPTKTADSRTVVAVSEKRQPIAVGPKQEPERKVVAAPEPKDTVVEPTPPPAREKPPARVATPPKPQPEQPKPAVVTPKKQQLEEPKPKPVIEPTEVAPKVKAVAKSGPPGELYFGVNSFDGGARGTAMISTTVRWLTDNADMKVVIEGHADPSGDADSNMVLAKKRADWAYQALVSAGIDASRLEVAPYGDTRLKYGAADARNRRIVIVPKTP